jgi:thymidylate synthase
MENPYIDIPTRKIGSKFRAAEAAWILSGDNRVSTIKKYSKQIKEYSDDGDYFAGAYGPPFRDQLPYVLNTLRADSHSRQALINIWRPRPYASKDIPCTVSLQFLIRDSRVNCVATMRSSDAWLGWVYDVHNFSCISAFIALHLNVGIGTLYLTAGSQHLYDCNIAAAKKVLNRPHTPIERKLKWKGMNPDEFIESLWRQANE